ncbi:hypothetical protein WJX82_000038 [Trebouxia sp. C0006]
MLGIVKSNVRKNKALLRRLSSIPRQDSVDSVSNEASGTIPAFYPTVHDKVISQSLGTFEVLGCGTEILPLGTRHASRSLYENFLPRPANFIVQGCGDMELAQAISSPSQAVPQVEQAADPCSYVNCCWGLSYPLMLVMMVVMVAMSALAVASVLVYMVVSSCVHFLWHLTLMCEMSGALLVVWYACQAGCNRCMGVVRSVCFKGVAVLWAIICGTWDIIRGTDRQQNGELEVYGPLMDPDRAGFFDQVPRLPRPTPTAQLRVLIPFDCLPSQIGFAIPGWGNVSAANCANLLRFLPDSGHMTDGFDRQASHLRILRACLVTQVMNALLEWMYTPTHSAGLAASGVMPMTPETVCAIIRRVYRRSRSQRHWTPSWQLLKLKTLATSLTFT